MSPLDFRLLTLGQPGLADEDDNRGIDGAAGAFVWMMIAGTVLWCALLALVWWLRS